MKVMATVEFLGFLLKARDLLLKAVIHKKNLLP